jgi:hypothetical protein
MTKRITHASGVEASERSMSMSVERVQAEKSLGAFRISRRDFLKIGGAGLVGASLFGVAGCGGGGGGQQGGGGGGGGGNTITVGYDQEPEVLNRMHASGTALATTSTTSGIQQFPIQIMPDFTYAPLLMGYAVPGPLLHPGLGALHLRPRPGQAAGG